jgi:hypothetical protein
MSAAWGRPPEIRMRIGAPHTVVEALRLDPGRAERRTVRVLELAGDRPASLLDAGVSVSEVRAEDRTVVVVRIPAELARSRRIALDAGDEGSEPGRQWVREWDGIRATSVLVLEILVEIPVEGPVDPGLAPLLGSAQLSRLCEMVGGPVERLAVLGQLEEFCWTVRRARLDLRVRRWRELSGHPGPTGPGRDRFDGVELDATVAADDAPVLEAVIRSVARGLGADPELGLAPIELRAAAHLARRSPGRPPRS